MTNKPDNRSALSRIPLLVWLGGIAALAVLLCAGLLYLDSREGPITAETQVVTPATPTAAPTAQAVTGDTQPLADDAQPATGDIQPTTGDASIEGVVIFPDPGRNHQEGDIAYSQDAPVGGLHNPQWLNCGIYENPVRVENVVHSLEHGAVWIAYQPDLPADQVEILQELVRQEQAASGGRWVILAPLPGLEDPVVATAWQVQLRLDNATDERLLQFIKEYQQGPFHPEPGASCMFGGIGEPLS